MMSVRNFIAFTAALTILASVATSRPGRHFHPYNTLFISYSYIQSKNPNPNIYSTRIFAIFNDPTPIQTDHTRFSLPDPDIQRPRVFHDSSVASSIHDRTKDIVSVIVALLFGVGCGSLASATMYFVWSIYSNRSNPGFDDSEYESDDDASPKKVCYVGIPTGKASEKLGA